MQKFEYRAIMSALKLIADDKDEKKALENVRTFINDTLKETEAPDKRSPRTSKATSKTDK